MESSIEKSRQETENKNANMIQRMMFAFTEPLLRIQFVLDVLQDGGRQRVKTKRYGSLSSKNLQSNWGGKDICINLKNKKLIRYQKRHIFVCAEIQQVQGWAWDLESQGPVLRLKGLEILGSQVTHPGP